MSTELSEGLILDLIQSKEEFPISLDEAWEWLGYAQKSNALRLLKSRFEEGLDFSSVCVKNASAGRPSDQYWITTDCLKCLGMMAATEKGNEIRRYFLICERALLERSNATPPVALPTGQKLKRLEYVFAETEAFLNALSDSFLLKKNMTAWHVVSASLFNLSELRREICSMIPGLAPSSSSD
jgi:phage anti-repressor protein